MRFRSGLLPLASLLPAFALVLAAPLPAQTADAAAAVRQVAEANNAFGVALYREFAQQEKGNLVFSPFSLSSVLALTATGAHGQTEKELWQALRLDLPREQVAAGYAGIAQAFVRATSNETAVLTVANSLWPQQGYALKPEFLDVAHRQFGAEVTPLDYAQPAAAAGQINEWIKTKTAGLIPRLVEPSQFSATTRLTLCNAVHFKAAWENKFVENATKPEFFTLRDRSSIKVPMMKKTGWFQVSESGGGQLLRLPYLEGTFEMVVVLPASGGGLQSMEWMLDRARLETWLSELEGAKPQSLSLELPKFKILAQPDCMAALKRLGLNEALNAFSADFAGISTEPMLSIDGVLHRAVIEVNEKGTEASAVTVICAAGGYAPPRAPQPFKVDHPFLFFIRETRTGAILFMGRVVDPRAE